MSRVRTVLRIAVIATILTPAAGASQASVPDSKDLRNEINIIRTRQEEQQKHYDDKFTGLSKQIDEKTNTVQFVLALLMGVTVVTGAILRWLGVRDRADVKTSVTELQAAVENAGAELKKRMKEMDETFDKRVIAVREELGRAGDAIQRTISERMDQTYDRPDELKREIIGEIVESVFSQFERPGLLKREVLNEMILLLQHHGVVDDQVAKRMHARIDHVFGAPVKPVK